MPTQVSVIEAGRYRYNIIGTGKGASRARSRTTFMGNGVIQGVWPNGHLDRYENVKS